MIQPMLNADAGGDGGAPDAATKKVTTPQKKSIKFGNEEIIFDSFEDLQRSLDALAANHVARKDFEDVSRKWEVAKKAAWTGFEDEQTIDSFYAMAGATPEQRQQMAILRRRAKAEIESLRSRATKAAAADDDGDVEGDDEGDSQPKRRTNVRVHDDNGDGDMPGVKRKFSLSDFDEESQKALAQLFKRSQVADRLVNEDVQGKLDQLMTNDPIVKKYIARLNEKQRARLIQHVLKEISPKLAESGWLDTPVREAARQAGRLYVEDTYGAEFLSATTGSPDGGVGGRGESGEGEDGSGLSPEELAKFDVTKPQSMSPAAGARGDLRRYLNTIRIKQVEQEKRMMSGMQGMGV